MIQRIVLLSMAGLFVAAVPTISTAAPTAAGAGASTSTATTSASPAATTVAAPSPLGGGQGNAEPPSLFPDTAPHVRRGGYLRLAFGAGYMFGNSKPATGGTQRYDAMTFVPELSIGAAVANGLVVGGGVYGTVPGYRVDTAGPSFLLLACPFADLYPDRTKGFNVVAGPCYANARFESQGVSLQGWGANLGIGYEWEALWGSDLGRGWGLGVLARVQYANVSGTTNVDPFSAVMPSVLISATWY
jgi:hypothetical protein